MKTNPHNLRMKAERAARLASVLRSVEAAGPAGALTADIDNCGMGMHFLRESLQELAHAGKVFGQREGRDGRSVFAYYAHADWAAANKPKATGYTPEQKARRLEAAKALRHKRAGGAPKDRPKKLPQPKPHQALTLAKVRAAAPILKAPIPADFPVTRIPTPPPRFAPEPGFVRVITQDWRDRRAQEMAA